MKHAVPLASDRLSVCYRWVGKAGGREPGMFITDNLGEGKTLLQS